MVRSEGAMKIKNWRVETTFSAATSECTPRPPRPVPRASLGAYSMKKISPTRQNRLWRLFMVTFWGVGNFPPEIGRGVSFPGNPSTFSGKIKLGAARGFGSCREALRPRCRGFPTPGARSRTRGVTLGRARPCFRLAEGGTCPAVARVSGQIG